MASTGTRIPLVFKMGRTFSKTAAYRTAGAASFNATEPIKVFYDRLVDAGKLKKVTFVAFMRKLLTILNAIVKAGKPWDATVHHSERKTV